MAAHALGAEVLTRRCGQVPMDSAEKMLFKVGGLLVAVCFGMVSCSTVPRVLPCVCCFSLTQPRAPWQMTIAWYLGLLSQGQRQFNRQGAQPFKG